jgi:hypothetical protein
MTTTPQVGRPSKLTPELIAKLSNYIAKGNYAITACKCCGISEHTFYDYVKLGEADLENGVESLYAQFLQSIKSAEAEAEASLASMIKETALEKREWLPAMTFLERRHPERWGRKDRLDIDKTERKEVTVIVYHEPGQIPASNPKLIDSTARVLDNPT